MPVFEAAGIPVIRLGLNPTEDLSGGDAVGGAYHPALGELVRARIARGEAEALLVGTPEGADAVLEVPARLMSQYVGQHGCNRDYLVRKFGLHSLKFIPSAQSKGVKRDA